MIGDRLSPGAARVAGQVAGHLRPLVEAAAVPFVVAIAGESGSGKSTLAAALAGALARAELPAPVLQQDDYFVLPPASNSAQRRRDIGWVGVGEVRLARLAADVELIRGGAPRLTKPLVIHDEDRIVDETIDVGGCRAVLVEGTYVLGLPRVDFGIFLARDYRETLADRRRRGRDVIDAFGERVLALEHRLIAPQRARANVVVNGDFTVAPPRGDPSAGLAG